MLRIKELPDIEYLKSIFTLNSETGELLWKVSNCHSVKVGSIAGALKPEGYRIVEIHNKGYMYHRIIYAIHHGEHPIGVIDHIDGDNSNNKPSNLRLASAAQNAHNRKKQSDNSSGHKNVYWSKKKEKWNVRIGAFGKSYYCGTFLLIEDAINVAREQRKVLHGEFAVG
jgi:hypothetical protein